MPDPRVFWLTVTNIVLGLLVLLLVVGIATGVLCDLVARIRKRHAAVREMDGDMRRYFGGR